MHLPGGDGKTLVCVSHHCHLYLHLILAHIQAICSFVYITLMWLRQSSDLSSHFSTTVLFPPVEAHQVVITYLGLFLQTIFM